MLSETLAELTRCAGELNRQSDELNSLIEDFEDKLASAGVGVSVWLNEPFLLNPRVSREGLFESLGYDLGYGKATGGDRGWELMVKRVRLMKPIGSEELPTPYDDGEPMPLLKAPRVVRIEAVSRFEKLAEAMRSRIQSHLLSIADAKRFLSQPK